MLSTATGFQNLLKEVYFSKKNKNFEMRLLGL